MNTSGESTVTGPLFRQKSGDRGAMYLVLGVPGSGKTRLISDLASHWYQQDNTSVLVLTSNRNATHNLRRQLRGTLVQAQSNLVMSKNPVRTIHAYAYAIVEAHARAQGNPPPRLISAAEQDSTVRELILGNESRWPAPLRGAVNSPQFTSQLREVFQRSQQYGVGPEAIISLGKQRHRPEWVAAGQTWREYEQVMALQNSVGVPYPGNSPGALDATELLTAALDAVAEYPELLLQPLGNPGGQHIILVDDVQHCDPQARRLISLVARHAYRTILTSDPEQSVFWFQGAPEGKELWPHATRIEMGSSHRLAKEIAGCVSAIAPLAAAAVTTVREDPGEAHIRLYPTVADQAEGIMSMLTRAHVYQGVPWSRMVIITRSVTHHEASLARAALLANVPLHLSSNRFPLASHPTVAAILTVLKALAQQVLTADQAVSLLSSPLGGASIAHTREILRSLKAQYPDRSSHDLLAEQIMTEDHLEVPESVQRLRRIWKAAQQEISPQKESPSMESVLWAVWSESGLEEKWGEEPLAEEDFAAVRALFETSRGHTHAHTVGILASLKNFVEERERERIPVTGYRSEARRTPQNPESAEGVKLISAHSAAGQEWDVVVVCGVQEGQWPGFLRSQSVVGIEDLTAALDGMEPGVKLDEKKNTLVRERRLLYLACSRAKEQLLVTAVEGQDDLLPSRFVTSLLRTPPNEVHEHSENLSRETSWSYQREGFHGTPRSFRWNEANIVSSLREKSCGDDPRRAQQAADTLALLARSEIRGADPRDWHGLAAVSTDELLVKKGTVALSPSSIGRLIACPLRYFLANNARMPSSDAAKRGIAVHLLAAVHTQFSSEELQHAVAEAMTRVEARNTLPSWEAQRRREELEGWYYNFTEWVRLSRGELTELGVEIPVELFIPEGHPSDEDGVKIRLKGKIDRLEETRQGQIVIVDLKSSQTVPTEQATKENAQLACYQILVEESRSEKVAEGRLVFISAPRAKGGVAVRTQPAFSTVEKSQWMDTIHAAAQASNGPTFSTQPGPECTRCEARRLCPAWRRDSSELSPQSGVVA